MRHKRPRRLGPQRRRIVTAILVPVLPIRYWDWTLVSTGTGTSPQSAEACTFSSVRDYFKQLTATIEWTRFIHLELSET